MLQKVKKQLEWSARSERDLLAIDTHISSDNPVTAKQVVDYIISQAELLTRFPLMAEPKNGRAHGKIAAGFGAWNSVRL